jgi:transposase-like protein
VARFVSKQRRHWSPDEKIKLLRRHLIEKVPISTLCDEAQLPSMLHRWQEQLFLGCSQLPRPRTAGLPWSS